MTPLLSHGLGNSKSVDLGEMLLLFTLICIPLLSTSSPLMGDQEIEKEPNGNDEKEKNEIASMTTASTNADPENRFIDNYLSETYSSKVKESNHRTWRINRKALVPILIGIAVKALALIPLALTGLSIIGAIAIFFSKLSLAISAVMFLRRYFSTDFSSGGFFGLNPLGFPHPSYSEHNLKNQRMGGNFRRPNYDQILRQMGKYRAGIKIDS